MRRLENEMNCRPLLDNEKQFYPRVHRINIQLRLSKECTSDLVDHHMQDNIKCQRLWRLCGWLSEEATRREANLGGTPAIRGGYMAFFVQTLIPRLDEVVMPKAGVLAM